MLEWYRVGDDLDRGMDLLDELAQEFLPGGPAERVTYRQAFREHLGIDPLTASAEQLVQSVREQGIPIPESLPADDRDGWLDLLLTERVQPHLGRARATILYDYPASQAALARIRDDDPPVAERFELFVDGTEVANGYHELLDAEALSARNQEHNRHRVADGRFALPEHSRLLQAMQQGLPPCAGVALGFDRLLMLRLGATDISAVMAFPIERA
jgi:lysyl-tRNA synthetase class 2